jgi:peroxisomal membrane protein 2
MAVIAGAKTQDEVLRTVKAGFFSVIRITWIMSPLSMTIAQKFIPIELWVPFFNLLQFVLGVGTLLRHFPPYIDLLCF